MTDFEEIPVEQPKNKKRRPLVFVLRWFAITMLVLILGISLIIGYGFYRLNRVTTKIMGKTEKLVDKAVEEGIEIIDKGGEEIQDFMDKGGEKAQELVDKGGEEIQELILEEENGEDKE